MSSLKRVVNQLTPGGRDNNKLQAYILDLEQHVNHLEQRVRDRELDIDNLRRRREELEDLITELRDQIETSSRQHDTKIQRHVEELQRTKDDHRVETMKLTRDHTAQDQRTRRECSSEISTLTQRHEYEMDMLERQHQQEVTNLQTQHEQKEAVSRKQHAKQEGELKRQHEQQEGELKWQHEQRESDLSRQYEHRERKLRAAFTLQIDRLRQELTSHSEALIARDYDVWKSSQFSTVDLKQDPDEYIVGYFTGIQQTIDNLARLKWKDSQDIWDERTLIRLSRDGGQRILKINILKDQIWTLLHEFIFCSPFRVFGAEGRALEDQWNDRCGKDPQTDNGTFVWPLREVETERWRYITVRECRLALIEPVPSEYDPRAKVKKGFMKHINTLKQELRWSLEKMVYVGDAEVEKINQVAMDMVKAWLNCMMHRCRIVMTLLASTSVSMTEKARSAQSDSLVLNVMPCVKRYGDARGFDLEKVATIGKLDGEVADLS